MQPPGEIGWVMIPTTTPSSAASTRPGLAVLEFGHHLIHGGIRRHHDLAAERDHVIPHPAGRPLVARYLANLPQGQQVDRPQVLVHGNALWS
jgi:hypothetical protein